MAGQHLVLQNRKSIVAAALIGLGLLILFLNVGEAATLVRSLRIVGHEADSMGILKATAMAVRRALQAYLFNHTEFLRVLYEVLLSFSGILLIVTGTVFFAVMFAAGGESQKSDFAASHSAHSVIASNRSEHPASSSTPTMPPGLCGPAPRAHRLEPSSEIMEKMGGIK